MHVHLVGYLAWSYSGARGVAGSLLDDNQWHDVEFVRGNRNITVSVDRVPVNITITGEYKRLDLDRYVSYWWLVMCLIHYVAVLPMQLPTEPITQNHVYIHNGVCHVCQFFLLRSIIRFQYRQQTPFSLALHFLYPG